MDSWKQFETYYTNNELKKVELRDDGVYAVHSPRQR